MRITLVPLYLAATLFQKIRGARCSRRKFKRSLSPPVGLSPLAPLPSPLSLGRFQPFEAAPIYPSISEHTDKWVSLRSRLHAPVARCLMDAYRDQHACVKIWNKRVFFFFFGRVFRLQLGKTDTRGGCRALFFVYYSVF